MDNIIEIAKRHRLLIIEDAAQALGASLERVNGGAWGIAGVFSFYPAKLLGAYGDAGAVVTSDAQLASRLRALRDHGRISKTGLDGWGWNGRMDNLQAAVLNVKLKRVPAWIARRRQLAAIYDEQLSGIAQIRLPASPNCENGFFDVYQNYVIEAESRDALIEYLNQNGIECLTSWPVPLHHQPIGLSPVSLPQTELLAQRALSLPLTPELADEQVILVADSVRRFYA
jgi:dTDP-4-amino-4,6-dideoxygalactose transaminase